MAQNLKIILSPYQDNGTLNQVLFNDNIKIKGGSTIALTGFNGTIDSNDIERTIPEEIIRLMLNNNIVFRSVTIPSVNYTSFKSMMNGLQNYLNEACGVRLPVDVADDTLVGLKLRVESLDITKPTTHVKISIENHSLTTIVPTTEYDVDVDGAVTADESLLEPTDEQIEPTPYILQGGGFRVQFPINLTNKKNGTLDPASNAFMRLQHVTGRIATKRPTYTMFYVPSTTPANRKLVIQQVFFNLQDEQITTDYVVPSEQFYNYQTTVSPSGPFTTKVSNGYFIAVQTEGFIKFGYVQTAANSGGFLAQTIIFEDDLQMKWSADKKYLASIQGKNNSYPVPAKFVATQTNSPLVEGNINRGNSKVQFIEGSIWKKYIGMNRVNSFEPANEYSQSIISEFSPGFFNLEQLELALEIDAIKVQNFVSYKSNDRLQSGGRKNILAYFTPSTTIQGTDYVYQYSPTEPIYLKVDAKDDFEINRMGVRLLNTYTGKSIKAHALTFVITNK